MSNNDRLLILAAKNGDAEVIRIALNAGADISNLR